MDLGEVALLLPQAGRTVGVGSGFDYDINNL